MAGTENKIIRRRMANAYLSSVISISLVLLLVGVSSLLLVNTQSVSDFFKENVRVSVLLKPEVEDNEAADLKETLSKMQFVRDAEFVSKEQGRAEMAAMLGGDFLDVFETSPVPASYNVSLKAKYVSSDSLKIVEKEIYKVSGVDEVVYQQSLVEKLNANLSRISLAFAVIIALMLFISFVLINNVVRLTVFERRFTIHTMRLVGATKGFIRAPFLVKSAFLGLFSSFLAIIMLVGMLFFVRNGFPQLFEVFRMNLLLVVMGIVVASGLLICVGSTYFVVGKLVSLSKDELYY